MQSSHTQVNGFSYSEAHSDFLKGGFNLQKRLSSSRSPKTKLLFCKWGGVFWVNLPNLKPQLKGELRPLKPPGFAPA